MTRLVEIAAELQQFLDAKKWPNCIIGGLALQRWGEMRFTRDVDLTLLTGFGNEERFVEALLGKYESRVAKGLEFALNARVVLLRTNDGVGIDVALGGLPFEERMVTRASRFEFATEIFLRTCSAEDLIVMKAFADRGRDWLDVEGVIVRQGACLDWNVIRTELVPLCELKGTPETVTELENLRTRLTTI